MYDQFLNEPDSPIVISSDDEAVFDHTSPPDQYSYNPYGLDDQSHNDPWMDEYGVVGYSRIGIPLPRTGHRPSRIPAFLSRMQRDLGFQQGRGLEIVRSPTFRDLRRQSRSPARRRVQYPYRSRSR